MTTETLPASLAAQEGESPPPGMRILFITPRFPYPPLKGDTLRSYHQIRALSERGHRITSLSLAEAPVNPADLRELKNLCERVEVVQLPRLRKLINLGVGVVHREPLQVAYFRSPAFRDKIGMLLSEGRFDAIHATLIRVLPYVWGVRTPPVAVDLIDSLTLNLADRRSQVRGPKRIGYELEYRRVRRYERAVVRRFPALVVSSEADRRVLGGRHIAVIPNGVDTESFVYHGPEGRSNSTVVFTGNMGYHPNEEAVVWFATEVWPLLRKARPELCFQVVGTNPTERVRALGVDGSGIQVLGRVPDVTEYLSRAGVAVCPMRSGSGIQNKVLEAMSAGTPVVATAIANRGVQGTHGRELLVADNPAQFAASVTQLLDNREMAGRMSEAARAFVEENYRWDSHARLLEQVYRRMQPAGRGAKGVGQR